MREYKLLILVFIACWTLALVSLNSSIPNGNGDGCVYLKEIKYTPTPGPMACIAEPAFPPSRINPLEWIAAGFFILPLGVFAVLQWKHDFPKENDIESLKLIGSTNRSIKNK